MSNTTSMTCMSNDTFAGSLSITGGQNTIIWTYDGNAVIGSPCNAYTNVFAAAIEGNSNQQCGIEGNIIYADAAPTINIVSGPYGCTDATSGGVTATSMLVVLGMAVNEYSNNQIIIRIL